jgi:NitT/TauT family transport system substrate-binding protein
MNPWTLNRRSLVAVTTLSALSLAVPLLGAQPRLERAKVALAVGGQSALHYLPLTLADQLGYFKAEGLDVEIVDFSSGETATQALVSGAAQVGAGDFDQLLQWQTAGQMWQSFVLLARAPGIAFGVSPHILPGYRTWADLKGKRIGVSESEAPSHRMARLVLARAGLGAGDVNYVGLTSVDQAVVAFRLGQVHALSHGDPVMALLEQRGEIRIVADTRTQRGTFALFGGAMPSACLYAPADFIEKYPNTLQAMTHALVRSLKWLQTAGPRDLIKTVPEVYMLGDRALYLAAFNKMREVISPDGLMPDDGPLTALKAFVELHPAVKPSALNVSKAFTNQFATLAKARFNA